MRRSQVHIPGIVEFRMVGTVVALQDGTFNVNNDPDDRTYFVLANPWIAEMKVGDRGSRLRSAPVKGKRRICKGYPVSFSASSKLTVL